MISKTRWVVLFISTVLVVVGFWLLYGFLLSHASGAGIRIVVVVAGVLIGAVVMAFGGQVVSVSVRRIRGKI